MIQDAHYLREFARALSITASKAPREEWAALLNRHAVDTLEYEKTLHESVFAEYGISTEQVAQAAPSPASLCLGAYIDRLTNHVWRSRLLLCWERKFEYAVEDGNLEQQRRSVVSIPN